MLYGIPLAPAISTAFGIIVLWVCAWLVITRRLVWHTDLAKAEAQFARDLAAANTRADRWEGIALTALSAAERLTVHAEVTNEVLTSLPTSRPQGGADT